MYNPHLRITRTWILEKIFGEKCSSDVLTASIKSDFNKVWKTLQKLQTCILLSEHTVFLSTGSFFLLLRSFHPDAPDLLAVLWSTCITSLWEKHISLDHTAWTCQYKLIRWKTLTTAQSAIISVNWVAWGLTQRTRFSCRNLWSRRKKNVTNGKKNLPAHFLLLTSVYPVRSYWILGTRRSINWRSLSTSAVAHVCHISAVCAWHMVTYGSDDPKMDSSISVYSRRLKLAKIEFDCASQRC